MGPTPSAIGTGLAIGFFYGQQLVGSTRQIKVKKQRKK